MQSSQISMLNRLGILISTAYNTESNPMTEEINYCSKVLDGLIDDETCFSLLYMPDNTKDWLSDKTLRQANPLAIEMEDTFNYLVEQRKKAIEMPSAQANFKTKHLNIFINGDDTETYISLEDFRKCKISDYDWDGKEVFLGLDLSMSVDNTSLAMVTYDYDLQKYVVKSWAFIPRDNVAEKVKIEKVDYYVMAEQGFCYMCGDKVIDYSFVEKFIMDLESTYGVKVLDIGYDRYNCISTANKLDMAGFNTTELKQHSSVLHQPTKLLKESVLTEKFAYEKNTLLEMNLANARESKDTNLNGYVNKKKSSGKVDMIVSLINAMALWHNEKINGSVYDSEEYRKDGFIII